MIRRFFSTKSNDPALFLQRTLMSRNSGQRLSTWSASSRTKMPLSTSCMHETEVSIFVKDATQNVVSKDIGVLDDTPVVPEQC